MIEPPTLKAGDRVGVASPSGPANREPVEKGLEILRDWDLEPIYSESIFGADKNRPYLAKSDEERLHELQKMLDDPDLKAILFTRGGYGMMRLLPRLDFSAMSEYPKVIVGFSDITALLSSILTETNLIPIHGPVLKTFQRYRRQSPGTLDQLKQTLFSGLETREYSNLKGVTRGTAHGRLIGGNLSVVCSLLDTPFFPNLSDSILFIEEVGEADYRLDRLFTTLQLSSSADSIAGIALGSFTDCGGDYLDNTEIDRLVANLCREFEIPAVAGLPSGHGQQNRPIPLGVPAHLDANTRKLRIQNPE